MLMIEINDRDAMEMYAKAMVLMYCEVVKQDASCRYPQQIKIYKMLSCTKNVVKGTTRVVSQGSVLIDSTNLGVFGITESKIRK